jgi:hypothetical protein
MKKFLLFKVNPRNWCCTWRRGARVLHCQGECWTHSSHWRLWCQVGYILWWQAKSRRNDQQREQDRSPWLPLDTDKDPRCRAQTGAIILSPAKTALICFHDFAKPPQIKKLYRRNQNEVRHCLAAGLRPVTEGLVDNMEAHTTLEGQRMVANCEQERR